MGKRVHVVKKQEQYGNSEAFNWSFEEFHSLLDLLGCEVCAEDEYADRFECLSDNYRNALDCLKRYKKIGMKSRKMKALMDELGFDEEELTYYLAKLGEIDYVIQSMQRFWEERDKKSSYIQFVAW